MSRVARLAYDELARLRLSASDLARSPALAARAFVAMLPHASQSYCAIGVGGDTSRFLQSLRHLNATLINNVLRSDLDVHVLRSDVYAGNTLVGGGGERAR